MENPPCLIGNKFDAQCMEVSSIKNERRSWNIKLKRSAKCRIKKPCSDKEDIALIGQYKRAFEVKVNEGDIIEDHQVTLLCQFCDEPVPKDVYKQHGGQHKTVPFKLNRSSDMPLICTKDEKFSNEAKISIASSITTA